MRRVAEWVVQAERVALRRRTPLVNGERGKLVIGLRGVELRRLNELGDGLLAEGREAAELATLLVALLEGYHLVLPDEARSDLRDLWRQLLPHAWRLTEAQRAKLQMGAVEKVQCPWDGLCRPSELRCAAGHRSSTGNKGGSW
jgi:hypothetical protein